MTNDSVELEEGLNLNLQFEKRGGLLPVTVQEASTGQILMLASLTKEAFQISIETGLATFWSTSRNELWTKGKTSGDYLLLRQILVDCDQDALVFRVEIVGDGVCHTFESSGKHRKACFYRSYEPKTGKLRFLKGMQ